MKQRKIKISEFKVDKKSLDEVMDKFKEMFGTPHNFKTKEYRSLKDLIEELEDEEESEEEEENYNIDEVIGELIEENQVLKVRFANLEDKVRTLNKAVVTLAKATEPCSCNKEEEDD